MAKKIIFSDHALARMEERSISKRLALGAVIIPDKIEKSLKNDNRFLFKKIYFNKKAKSEHLLILVAEIFLEKIEIITIIDTSKIGKHF